MKLIIPDKKNWCVNWRHHLSTKKYLIPYPNILHKCLCYSGKNLRFSNFVHYTRQMVRETNTQSFWYSELCKECFTHIFQNSWFFFFWKFQHIARRGCVVRVSCARNLKNHIQSQTSNFFFSRIPRNQFQKICWCIRDWIIGHLKKWNFYNLNF